jgi:glutaredoxin 3
MSDVEVLVYRTRWCGYCRRAASLLTRKSIEFREISVDGDREARAWLREQTGQRTVPQIFIGGRSIGGFRELSALERTGALDEMLSPASATR